MFKQLANYLRNTRDTIYVRVCPEKLFVCHVETRVAVCDVPVLALESNNGHISIAAIGSDALEMKDRADISLIHGFFHADMPVANALISGKILQSFIEQACRGKAMHTPFMIIHPTAGYAEKLTPHGKHAFIELGMSVGAANVFVWEGPRFFRDRRLDTRPERQRLTA